MENAGARFLRHGIHFVYGDEKRFAGGAQEPRQFFAERRKTRLAIDYQNEQRGFLDGYMGLAQDLLRDQSFVIRNDAAGIHNFQRPSAPLGFAVNPVTSDARLVGDD